MEEQKLIKNCIKGNVRAQKILFERYYHQMYHLSMRFLTNHHDAEDILIISFTRVFDKIKGFEYRGENSLKKWIKTIVINESLRFLEHKKSMQYEDNLLLIENEALIDIDEELISIDTEEVYQIIENMPAGYRTVFNLYAIEGYTHQEISDMLNVTISTSKSQLCKARSFILSQIKEKSTYGSTKY